MSLLGLLVPEMIQVSEGRTDKSIPEVDLSQAVKIGRLSDGLIRYTFDLSSNQPHVFSNLIVIEHPEHEPMSYITEYHPDRDWLIEKAGNWKAIDYTGYVLTKALDGQVLTVSEYEHGEGDIFKYDPEAGEAGRTACDPLFGWSPGDFTGWVDVGNGSWSNFNTGTSSFSSGDPSGGSWTIIIIKTTQPDDDFSGDGENPSGGGSDLWITRTSCGGGYDPNAILCNGTGNCSQVTAVTSVFCEDECDEEELCDQNPLTTWVAGECECTFGKGENGECVSEAEAWEANNITTTRAFKNNPCASGVWDDLENSNALHSMLKQFINNTFDMNIKLTLDVADYNCASNKLCRGKVTPDGGNFKLILHQDYLSNASPIAVAKTIMHEAIHAHLYYYHLVVLNKDNNITLEDFPGLMNYYLTNKDTEGKIQLKPAHHNHMADWYRDVIIGGMKDYDTQNNTSHTDTFYEAMSWGGLKNTDAWRNDVSQSNKTSYSNTLTQEDNKGGCE